MKKFTLLCAAVLASSSMAFASDYVTETTNTGVDAAIEACGGDGIFDVFVLSEDAVQRIKNTPGITLNNYRQGTDETTIIGNGGNLGWTDEYATEGLENNDMYGSFQIHGFWWQWWAAAFVMNKGGARDFSHLNENTHLHLAVWTDSQILADLDTRCFILKDDGNNTYGVPMFSLTNPDNFDATAPIVGSMQPGKWVALDVTLGDIAAMMEDEFEIPLDYTRFTAESTMPEMLTIQTPFGQDGANDGAPSDAHADNAKICLDAFYFYTPKNSGGVEDIEKENCKIIVGNRTISTMGGAGIELYNTAGVLVGSTNDNIICTDGLAAGVYFAKSNGNTTKVLIK